MHILNTIGPKTDSCSTPDHELEERLIFLSLALLENIFNVLTHKIDLIWFIKTMP